MCTLKHRALTLVAALAVVAAGCSGNNGKGGADGQNGNNGDPGAPGSSVPPGISNSGLAVEVTGTGVDAANQVTVTFTMKDINGLPVDFAGVFSVNTLMQPRFALAYISTAADGSVLPYTVLTASGTPAQPTALSPVPNPGKTADPANGVLTPSATTPGTYTYTFPVSVALDAAKAGNTHTIWIQASRQTDLDDPSNTRTFTAVNEEFNFVPNGGALPVARRQVVATENCSKCHSNFKPEGLVSNQFHSGGRMEAPFCNICHNAGHVSNPIANAPVFVHRIHAAKQLQAASVFDGIAETAYPQDLRNCAACHANALQGDQFKTKPTRAACGSCHDYVNFSGSGTVTIPPIPPATITNGFCTDPVSIDPASGKPYTCFHAAGTGVTQDDGNCASCHSPTGSLFIGERHIPIADPNPANILVPQTSGVAKAGAQTTATCTGSAPCTCLGTAGNICISPNYTFVTTGTVTDGAFFQSSTGVPCSTTSCTCVTNDPCFANPFSQVKSGTATAGFGGGTACTSSAPCNACTPGSPCIGAGNNNTNAASVAAAGAVPTGAIQISYDLKSVSRDASNHPVIVFKLKQSLNGAAATDVVFKTFDPNVAADQQELMANFVGSPSVYWVFAVPQDNILTPADYNGSDSTYVRSIWNHTATNSVSSSGAVTPQAGAMTGPDAQGYYKITLSNAIVPDEATMLTGGVGYTYALSTTPPLVQTNVSGFPYDAATRTGGLIVPAADVKLVASTGKTTGTQTVGKQGSTACTTSAPCTCTVAAPCSYPPRRQIIDNKKCQNCHVTLGANPTFHAGQRNDGEICSWCHNPNQNNSGWSGNAKDMIHALHAGTAAGVALPNGTFSAGTGKRSYPYTWDAESVDEGFWEVTFPGPRNNCEACHATLANPLQHTYDFSAPDSAAAVPNLLWSTDATNAVTLQNFVSSSFLSAPYVAAVTTGTITAGTQGAVTCTVAASCTCTVQNPCLSNFGANAGFDKVAGVLTDGAATNLVTSPITAACIACHDSPTQKSHIIAMNGQFYVARSVAKGLTTTSLTDPNQESCLVCHGPQPNSIAPIADMHKQ